MGFFISGSAAQFVGVSMAVLGLVLALMAFAVVFGNIAKKLINL
jgi:hypothetical protein